jgi:hypothetical protein
LENLEEAFDLMKRASGVDTVEEVVERFKTQDFTGKVNTYKCKRCLKLDKGGKFRWMLLS